MCSYQFTLAATIAYAQAIQPLRDPVHERERVWPRQLFEKVRPERGWTFPASPGVEATLPCGGIATDPHSDPVEIKRLEFEQVWNEAETQASEGRNYDRRSLRFIPSTAAMEDSTRAAMKRSHLQQLRKECAVTLPTGTKPRFATLAWSLHSLVPSPTALAAPQSGLGKRLMACAGFGPASRMPR